MFSSRHVVGTLKVDLHACCIWRWSHHTWGIMAEGDVKATAYTQGKRGLTIIRWTLGNGLKVITIDTHSIAGGGVQVAAYTRRGCHIIHRVGHGLKLVSYCIHIDPMTTDTYYVFLWPVRYYDIVVLINLI